MKFSKNIFCKGTCFFVFFCQKCTFLAATLFIWFKPSLPITNPKESSFYPWKETLLMSFVEADAYREKVSHPIFPQNTSDLPFSSIKRGGINFVDVFFWSRCLSIKRWTIPFSLLNRQITSDLPFSTTKRRIYRIYTAGMWHPPSQCWVT